MLPKKLQIFTCQASVAGITLNLDTGFTYYSMVYYLLLTDTSNAVPLLSSTSWDCHVTIE